VEFGLNGNLLKVLCDYLLNRTFSIKLKNFKLNCGVPQGSLLAPLLFILFINDGSIPLQFLTTLSCVLYADDLILYVNCTDCNAGLDLLKEILNTLDKWCLDNEI